MRAAAPSRAGLDFLVLALTQTMGWGAVGILPVLAPPIAAAFGTSLARVFVGTSAMFVAMGLAAPLAARALCRFGARTVMVGGAVGVGLGLVVLGLSPGLAAFWAAWVLIGAAGAMVLTTAAQAYLAETTGSRARSRIGALMLVTGLAGSLSWPVTALLEQAAGWRAAVLVHACALVLFAAPLLLLCLQRTRPKAAASGVEPLPARPRRAFPLLVAAISLNSFVTFGIDAVGIELLRAVGADLPWAVAIASGLGVCKVAGRLVDVLGGQRWDGLSTALVAGAMIPAGLVALLTGGAEPWSVGLYLLLYGCGSGAFAVSRATLPLVFFDKAEYAVVLSRLALPMNLINAAAPPALAALLTGIGPRAVLGSLACLACAAGAVLLRLRALRPPGPGATGRSEGPHESHGPQRPDPRDSVASASPIG